MVLGTSSSIVSSSRTSVIRNRNTFVYFVVLIWNIFLFTINTQTKHSIVERGGGCGKSSGCVCALQTVQYPIRVSIFSRNAHRMPRMSAGETLFAFFFCFFLRKICCGVFIFTIYSFAHTHLFDWAASESNTNIALWAASESNTLHCTHCTPQMTEFTLMSSAENPSGHKTNRGPSTNNKQTHIRCENRTHGARCAVSAKPNKHFSSFENAQPKPYQKFLCLGIRFTNIGQHNGNAHSQSVSAPNVTKCCRIFFSNGIHFCFSLAVAAPHRIVLSVHALCALGDDGDRKWYKCSSIAKRDHTTRYEVYWECGEIRSCRAHWQNILNEIDMVSGEQPQKEISKM